MELSLDELRSRMANAAGIESLVRDQIEEGHSLDFKRSAYEKRSEKPEFLRDVIAFANHVGGFIVIGIDEDRHIRTSAASKIVGVSDADRLEKRVRDWLSESPVKPYPLTDIGASARTLHCAGKDVVAVYVPCRPKGDVFTMPRGHYEEAWVRAHRKRRLMSTEEIRLHRERDPKTGWVPILPPVLRWLGDWFPDFLTMVRPPLGILAGLAAFFLHPLGAYLLYVTGLLTDIFDGAFAKLLKASKERGKHWDQRADIAFNLAAACGLLLAATFRNSDGLALMLLVIVGAAIALSRIWVEPHSAVAKYRSGAIRLTLLFLFWWHLPSDDRLGLGLLGALPVLLGGVVELVLTEIEVRHDERPFRRQPSDKA